MKRLGLCIFSSLTVTALLLGGCTSDVSESTVDGPVDESASELAAGRIEVTGWHALQLFKALKSFGVRQSMEAGTLRAAARSVECWKGAVPTPRGTRWKAWCQVRVTNDGPTLGSKHWEVIATEATANSDVSKLVKAVQNLDGVESIDTDVSTGYLLSKIRCRVEKGEGADGARCTFSNT